MYGTSIDEIISAGYVSEDQLIASSTAKFKIDGDTLTIGQYTYTRVS